MSTGTEKKKPLHWRSLWWLLLSVAVFVIDRWTKIWMTKQLMLGQSKSVTSFFSLTLLHNRGAAFGLLGQASGWQQWLFMGIAVLVGAMILAWLLRLEPRQWVMASGLTLILGGALGNLYDRIMLGYVIDFFHFYWQSWHFAVFNVADAAITVGAACLIIKTLFSR